MAISSIGNTIAQALQSTSALRKSSSSSVVTAAEGSDNDSSSLSGPAQTLSKLKALQQSDPAKFKQVMTSISEGLSSMAETASSEDQKMLTDLASRFKSAGETGDLSSLAPPAGGKGPPPAGKGPPPAGGKGPGSSTTDAIDSAKVADPADTNSDGTVSAKEKQAYEAKQAAAKERLNPAVHQAYSQQAQDGKENELISRVNALVQNAVDSVA